MYVKKLLLVAAGLSVSACAAERWPGQRDNDPSASDYPIVQQRFETASKKSLGTSGDISEIKGAILKVHPEMNIDEIRWISATEVVVYTDRDRNSSLGYESFFCALQKKGQTWNFVAAYLYLIS